MKHVLLLSLSLLFSVSSFARDSVEREAFGVAYEIQREAPYLSDRQEGEILEHLRRIREILRSGGDSYEPGQYSCVSRDNDGANPWVLGLRQGVQVTRIAGTTFNTKPDCENNLRASNTIGGTTFICLSRDNDGASPYIGAVLDQTTITKLPASAANSLTQCQTFVRDLKVNRGSVSYCGSRDNDGAAPYRASSYDLRSGQVTNSTETFQSLDACKRWLNE